MPYHRYARMTRICDLRSDCSSDGSQTKGCAGPWGVCGDLSLRLPWRLQHGPELRGGSEFCTP